jgi:protein-S-isoprenylcysteine O-methyltransferase Ste14
MVALHMLFPVRQLIPGWYRFLGGVPLAAGLVLNAWAAGLFDRARTTIKPFEKSSVLVNRGPYRISRNPMYLGMVLGLVGIGVLAGSVTPLLVVPVFACLIDRRFIRAEEAFLQEAFGASYVAYQARVRRWL